MKTISIVTVSFFTSVLYNGCRSDKAAETTTGKISFAEKIENGMTLDTVIRATVENELKLTGRITFDEEKVIMIYPVVSGTVTEVKAGIGDHVEKGQVLAVIKSSEMAGIENDIITAQSNYEIAQKNFNTTEELYKGGIASEKEVVTVQKELQKAKSELERARNVSNLFGGTGNPDYYVKSPITGEIVEKRVNPNMQIRTDYANNLFTISDLKNVWVMANVYETDIANVKQGYNAEVTTLSYPEKIYHGKIDRVYSVLDPDSKVMKIRIRLENPDHLLKPEMFANIVLRYSENLPKLRILSKTIIFDNSKNYVIVYRDKEIPEIREISTYKSTKEYTYINSGLKEGDKIFSSNQLLIYNELIGK